MIDSFVVDLLFFLGGDIGKLVIYGMVNDLVVGGVKLFYLICLMIIEEGFEIEVLCRVVVFMKVVVEEVGVLIVIGDIKVVYCGVCDKFFINIVGVGVIFLGCEIVVC